MIGEIAILDSGMPTLIFEETPSKRVKKLVRYWNEFMGIGIYTKEKEDKIIKKISIEQFLKNKKYKDIHFWLKIFICELEKETEKNTKIDTELLKIIEKYKMSLKEKIDNKFSNFLSNKELKYLKNLNNEYFDVENIKDIENIYNLLKNSKKWLIKKLYISDTIKFKENIENFYPLKEIEKIIKNENKEIKDSEISLNFNIINFEHNDKIFYLYYNKLIDKILSNIDNIKNEEEKINEKFKYIYYIFPKMFEFLNNTTNKEIKLLNSDNLFDLIMFILKNKVDKYYHYINEENINKILDSALPKNEKIYFLKSISTFTNIDLEKLRKVFEKNDLEELIDFVKTSKIDIDLYDVLYYDENIENKNLKLAKEIYKIHKEGDSSILYNYSRYNYANTEILLKLYPLLKSDLKCNILENPKCPISLIIEELNNEISSKGRRIYDEGLDSFGQYYAISIVSNKGYKSETIKNIAQIIKNNKEAFGDNVIIYLLENSIFLDEDKKEFLSSDIIDYYKIKSTDEGYELKGNSESGYIKNMKLKLKI